MRQFQRVLAQLKDVVLNHKPGENLKAPPLLPFITVNGRKVYYAAMGLENDASQPAVVLLHGFGGFFMDWPRVMAPISRHARVYALDLPGWGFSEMNPESKSMEDDVTILREFMRELGLEKVILGGLSYGAGVAWAAAAMNLPRIQRVVLINPMPPHPLRYFISPIYKAIFAICRSRTGAHFGNRLMGKAHYKIICRENLLNDRLLDSFYLDLAYLVMKQPKMSSMLHSHARGAGSVDWNEWERRLSKSRVPVSILQGLQDRVFSFESAAHLYDLIPNSELIEVDQCGHAMCFDQPRKVSDFFIAALTRQEESLEQEASREATPVKLSRAAGK